MDEEELVLFLVDGVSYYTGEEFQNVESWTAHGHQLWVQDLQIICLEKKKIIVIS